MISPSMEVVRNVERTWGGGVDSVVSWKQDPVARGLVFTFSSGKRVAITETALLEIGKHLQEEQVDIGSDDGRPKTFGDALLYVAEWMDLMDEINGGDTDQAQKDLRKMAEWISKHEVLKTPLDALWLSLGKKGTKL